MELGTGAVAIANLLRWTAGRTWLALLLAAGVIAAFAAHERAHPLPEYGSGLAIIDEQMRRSHALPRADVLVVGDSSSLYGVDPAALAEALAGMRVESLAAIGPVRPPGYVKLLENHLARGEAPRVVLLLLNPLGLADAVGEHERQEMYAVLADRWPQGSLREGAVRALNFRLFGGVLEEPLEGDHGRHYGSGRELRRALRRGHGSLLNPAPRALRAPSAEKAQPGVRYEMHDDGVRDLERVAQQLDAVDRSRILVGLMPAPAAMVGDETGPSRERMLRRVLDLLRLPPEQAIELPASLPTEEFVDPTHTTGAGRARLSAILADIVRGELAAAPSAPRP
ncbi:MAG: hypothetical protein AB1689_16335 [Thermodesulfobacteriota bacterium]